MIQMIKKSHYNDNDDYLRVKAVSLMLGLTLMTFDGETRTRQLLFERSLLSMTLVQICLQRCCRHKISICIKCTKKPTSINIQPSLPKVSTNYPQRTSFLIKIDQYRNTIPFVFHFELFHCVFSIAQIQYNTLEPTGSTRFRTQKAS